METPKMEMIECTTHYGKTKPVPKEKLAFRPSAYAIIVNGGLAAMDRDRRAGGESFS